MMYNFQPYDPATPRMVTSFKGNQKLIFEGYRYNIHHIVPAKNVKTWRCVCAKKLTSARSWCKGRAETWENDSHGTSKGEHNHPAEHDQAELEYFKSQLILAAIEFPDVNLNDLVDTATSMMSEGVSFSSRESLKKSLTQARKTAENGGFKLKSYKNSAESTGSRSKVHSVSSNNDDALVKKFPAGVNIKLFENGTMASLLSLAKQCQETNNNNELEDTRSNPSLDDFQQSTSSASSSILNQFVSNDFEDEQNAPPTKLGRFDDASIFNESILSILNCANLNQTASSGFGSMQSFNTTGGSAIDWANRAMVDYQINGAAAAMDSNRSTPVSNHGNDSTKKRKTVDKAVRAQRVNDIFNRLSNKAAAAASSNTTPHSTKSTPPSSAAPSTSLTTNGMQSSTTSSQKVSIETQTDSFLEDGAEIRVSACLGSNSCTCRIIRVCCCSNETCTRGIKRSHS